MTNFPKVVNLEPDCYIISTDYSIGNELKTSFIISEQGFFEFHRAVGFVCFLFFSRLTFYTKTIELVNNLLVCSFVIAHFTSLCHFYCHTRCHGTNDSNIYNCSFIDFVSETKLYTCGYVAFAFPLWLNLF